MEDEARRFPITARNPEEIPTGPGRLQTFDRNPPQELTKRELLAGIYTIVDELYDRPVTELCLQDTFTADVTFVDDSPVRVELLTDSKRITGEDLQPLIDMRPAASGLLIVTATSWVRHDARRLADRRDVDVVSVTPEPFATTRSQLALF